MYIYNEPIYSKFSYDKEIRVVLDLIDEQGKFRSSKKMSQEFRLEPILNFLNAVE